MSLETKIQELTDAVKLLTEAFNAQRPTSNVAPAPLAVVPPAPAPVAQTAPVAPAPAMPAPPSFEAPAPTPAPAASVVPFTDTKGLIDYVMNAYKTMGPMKGAQIQGILTSLGCQNINDVKPEQFAALHQAVEALKAS